MRVKAAFPHSTQPAASPITTACPVRLATSAIRRATAGLCGRLSGGFRTRTSDASASHGELDRELSRSQRSRCALAQERSGESDPPTDAHANTGVGGRANGGRAPPRGGGGPLLLPRFSPRGGGGG